MHDIKFYNYLLVLRPYGQFPIIERFERDVRKSGRKERGRDLGSFLSPLRKPGTVPRTAVEVPLFQVYSKAWNAVSSIGSPIYARGAADRPARSYWAEKLFSAPYHAPMMSKILVGFTAMPRRPICTIVLLFRLFSHP